MVHIEDLVAQLTVKKPLDGCAVTIPMSVPEDCC